MNTFTSKDYQYAFLALPQSVRDLICSLDVNDKMQGVAKQCALDDIQTETYCTIMSQCLYGLLSMDELLGELTKNLNIPELRTREILERSNQKFLNNVRDLLATSTTGLSSNASPRVDLVSVEHINKTSTTTKDVSMSIDETKQTNIDSQKSDGAEDVMHRFATESPLEQFIRKDPAITERFSKLPESVRAAIVSPEVATAFSSCVRAYDISEGSFKMLGMEIVRLLVGMQSTNDFRAHVRELTIVSAAQQDSLVSTTEKDIVRPVQEAIMAVLASRKNGA